MYFATKQYIDNVRVRAWEGFDPTSSLGTEQIQTPPAAPVLVSPANGSVGNSLNPTFSWEPSFSATEYHFQLSVTPNFLFVLDITGITTNFVEVTGLSSNTTYYWRVKAGSPRGFGDWSDAWSFVTCPNAPTISAGPDQQVCADAGTVTMAGFSFSHASGASWSGGSGSWNGNIYTPTPTEVSNGTVTLTYTTNTAAPCGDVSEDMVVTFIANPVATWTNLLTDQCITSNTYTLVEGSPAGGIFSGVGVTGSNFDATIAGTGSHTIYYTYTDPATNCSSTASNTIVVRDLPVVTSGTYGPVCIDAADITLAGAPAGGSWAGNGVSGTIETGFVFDPSAGTQTLTYSYTDAYSCSNSAQVTINVNALPSVDAGTYSAVCSDASDIILGGTPAGGTWTGTGVSGTIETGFVFDPSAGSQSLTYTYTDGNSCANSATTSITINELPVLNPGTYAAVCADAADVALSATPAGGSWTGTGVSGSIESGFTFDPSSGTQTLTYTYSDVNSCSNTAQVTITVNELPVLSTGSYGPVCINAADVALAGTPAGGTWSGTGVSGSIESGFVFDPSAGSQILTYSYTDGNSCSNTAQASILVNDLPEVSAGTYAAVCVNDADVVLGGTPTGGIWTGIGVSGSVETGFVFDPSAGTQELSYTYTDGNSCSNTAVITLTVESVPTVTAGTYGPACINSLPIVLSGSPAGGSWTGTGVSGNINDGFTFDPSNGTQTLTYSFTSGISCLVEDQATILVNTLPSVDAGTYTSVCVDAADVTLAGSPAGGTWTGTGVSGSVETGFVFDPSNGTQTLTYSYTDGNSCTNSAQAIITVLDLPIVSAGSYGPICINDADLTLGGSPIGGVWTGTGVSGTIETGFVFDPSNGTQTLTYTYTDGNNCANSAQVIINVESVPTVVAGTYGPACLNGFPFGLNGTPAGGTWTGTGVTGSVETGFVFDPAVGTQTLTYTYTSGVTCSSSDQTTVIVNSLPVVEAGTYSPVCINDLAVVLAGSPAGGSWSGNGVSGSIESGFVFDPSAGTQTLTYLFTDGNFCSNSAQTSITVLDLPVVEAGNYGPLCINSLPINLLGSPAGGEWTGNGVAGTIESGYTFDPSVGTKTLIYTYTDGNSCKNTSSATIVVNELPVVTAGSYGPVCLNASNIILAGSPAGGIWSGTGVSGSIESGFVFDPSAGSQTLTYSYTDGNFCSNSEATSIVVNDLPVIITGNYGPVCIDAADILLGGSPVGGTWTGNGISGSIEGGFYFDPSAGTQILTYTYVDANSCSNNEKTTITVDPLPTLDLGSYNNICTGSSAVALSATPAGGTWAGIGVSGSIESGFVFDPSAGTQTLTYSYTDGNTCSNTAQVTITVNELPVV
ncbi:MAG: hypothetical protein IPH88_06350 [Bacteroidales bacterium]|nr:hypothetical protein [Bacteroidales bacterium]